LKNTKGTAYENNYPIKTLKNLISGTKKMNKNLSQKFAEK
jgi:hypothetical protein